MLEYFAYKKYKKRKDEKEAGKDKLQGSPAAALGTPKQVLSDADEEFLQHLTTPTETTETVEDDEGLKPPLPPRVATPELSWDSDAESFRKSKKEKKTESKATDKITNRLSLILRRDKKATKEDATSGKQLTVPDPEVAREKDDLSRVLDDLSLSAKNNKAFALSAESSELVSQFTLVLKDLVNGVPTAVNDLTSLLDDRNGTLAKNFEKLPGSMKKLVTQLPDKLSKSFAPELLAVAAEVQGLTKEDAAARGGVKGAAKRLFLPKNLSELVTKPGAIVGMLKGIMNALKLRWPAFIGTNVIWSVAVFLLMFVLWYCHKRGREVRLEKERTVDGSDRIEELPDDPMLTAGPSIVVDQGEAGSGSTTLPPPPIGEHAPGKKSPVPSNKSK